VNPFARAAHDAGRAIGDCGAGEESALVEEVAVVLAELESEPEPTRRRPRRKLAAGRSKSEVSSTKHETNSKSE